MYSGDNNLEMHLFWISRKHVLRETVYPLKNREGKRGIHEIEPGLKNYFFDPVPAYEPLPAGDILDLIDEDDLLSPG